MSSTLHMGWLQAGIIVQAALAMFASSAAASTADVGANAKPPEIIVVATRVNTKGPDAMTTGSVSSATRPLDLELLTANDFGDADAEH